MKVGIIQRKNSENVAENIADIDKKLSLIGEETKRPGLRLFNPHKNAVMTPR